MTILGLILFLLLTVAGVNTAERGVNALLSRPVRPQFLNIVSPSPGSYDLYILGYSHSLDGIVGGVERLLRQVVRRLGSKQPGERPGYLSAGGIPRRKIFI